MQWASRHPKRVEVTGAIGEERKVSVRFTASEASKPLRFVLWVLTQLGQLSG